MAETTEIDTANLGHGHVRARADGMKAKCGGPGLCTLCSIEYAQLGMKNPIKMSVPGDRSEDDPLALAPALITEPTKQREGDQPLPVVNDLPIVQDEVVQFIQKRKELGISRYGTALQPHNGRDGLLDLLEELVDGVNYIAQLIIERDGKL